MRCFPHEERADCGKLQNFTKSFGRFFQANLTNRTCAENPIPRTALIGTEDDRIQHFGHFHSHNFNTSFLQSAYSILQPIGIAKCYSNAIPFCIGQRAKATADYPLSGY